MNPSSKPSRISGATLLAVLAVLAPLSYIAGRVSVPVLSQYYLDFLGTGLAATALGVMIGIPVGLFFGTVRRQPVAAPDETNSTLHPNTKAQEAAILAEIASELDENQALFDARKGSTVMYARIGYITTFWDAAKASGRLFVMQDMKLMNIISNAYYWLGEASKLEELAYRAKYADTNEGASATAEHLLREVRLLDGQITHALSVARDAIAAAKVSKN